MGKFYKLIGKNFTFFPYSWYNRYKDLYIGIIALERNYSLTRALIYNLNLYRKTALLGRFSPV